LASLQLHQSLNKMCFRKTVRHAQDVHENYAWRLGPFNDFGMSRITRIHGESLAGLFENKSDLIL
jgi:hypothetical protein